MRRALYNLDSELRILSANDQCLALWGKSLQEVVGRRMMEVFPEVVGTEPYEAHARAMKNLKPFRKVVRSPVLEGEIELEIHPTRAGLRVSFAKVETPSGD